ncbi:MAG: ATP-binding cassette domain-containing protein [Holosporales bacterium]|jgi:putative ABC transport system ATP-binding protein|nr:ATP-binding cassette domain-containing protein [Holosporales bacterium]
MLSLSNVSVRNTLNDLTLTVKSDEFVLIVGANGAGKTTLFNVISGEIKPRSGKILFKNMDITDTPQHKRTKWIASVLQDPRLGTVGEMTILENLSLAYIRNGYKKLTGSTIAFFKDKLRILEMNLENRLYEQTRNLSGGQRQALSLIMATITDYDLLLLDEITASLDPKNSSMVMKIAEKIVALEKKACMLITHNTKHIESFGSRILEMRNGGLVQVS